MSDTLLQSFPVGAGKLIPVDHKGPKLYTVGGETLGTTNNFTGISLLGLSEIDAVLVGAGISVSGNYFVVAKQVGAGNQKTFKLLWFTASSSVPSWTQASAIDLSAETVRLVYLGR